MNGCAARAPAPNSTTAALPSTTHLRAPLCPRFGLPTTGLLYLGFGLFLFLPSIPSFLLFLLFPFSHPTTPPHYPIWTGLVGTWFGWWWDCIYSLPVHCGTCGWDVGLLTSPPACHHAHLPSPIHTRPARHHYLFTTTPPPHPHLTIVFLVVWLGLLFLAFSLALAFLLRTFMLCCMRIVVGRLVCCCGCFMPYPPGM